MSEIYPENLASTSESKRSMQLCSNIVLVGISGSGKSTVGRHLAVLLGMGFMDLDNFIEKTSGKSVANIFADEGEVGFRAREADALERMSQLKSHVLALGAGALHDDRGLAIARKIGPLVWLRPSADEVARRLYMRVNELEKRPLFKDVVTIEDKEERRKVIRERIAKMTDDRSPMYQAADIVLDGGYVTPETSACQLKDIMMSMGLVTTLHDRFAIWRGYN